MKIKLCKCGGENSIYWCMCWNKQIATIKCNSCGHRTKYGRFSEKQAIEDFNNGILE